MKDNIKDQLIEALKKKISIIEKTTSLDNERKNISISLKQVNRDIDDLEKEIGKR